MWVCSSTSADTSPNHDGASSIAVMLRHIGILKSLPTSSPHSSTSICEWLALNKLNLNINKTKYIIFHFPQRNMAFLDLELKLCGQHIECVRQFVFLGITIHETLNWDRYIDKIANKISRTLGVMNKLKHFLPKYTLKIMYSSLIAPHFNNNILLWGFNTHRLIKLQKRAIRIITDSKYNYHTEPLLKSLNILKINDIFTIQCLKFFHNYINDRVPVFFRSFFVDMHCIMTMKLDIVTIFVFRTVILPKPENVLDITYPCSSICYQRKLLPNYILTVK